ncbi:chlorophyll(ide) b reductase NOL, chloroplastic-like isoform X1 [Impatiens glandulifera]|uniref:chlorophyll(ide) b reductase NOL, chloroplastic-like isoform X1 n=1 Tax=Impatiens glandulifera TaxID=253017 RepID=UPI001FB19A52|nr:chlorophyll(ide) b reductase NOL, chloroplastic-like isoform X1 [Impatiens glandulifera]
MAMINAALTFSTYNHFPTSPLFPYFYSRCHSLSSSQKSFHGVAFPSSLVTSAIYKTPASMSVRADVTPLNREQVAPPFNVLITGSTKGIGFALAKEFLKTGDNVIVCSRSAERVESALQSLIHDFGQQRVWGTTCDVRQGEDVKKLVHFAQQNLKHIDIWENMSYLYMNLLNGQIFPLTPKEASVPHFCNWVQHW